MSTFIPAKSIDSVSTFVVNASIAPMRRAPKNPPSGNAVAQIAMINTRDMVARTAFSAAAWVPIAWASSVITPTEVAVAWRAYVFLLAVGVVMGAVANP